MKNYPYYEHKKLADFEELLSLNLDSRKNKTAFRFMVQRKVKKISYQDLYEDAHNLANFLAKKYQNSHIAIVAGNSYEWIVAFFGIVLSNNTVVVVDKNLGDETIDKYLKATDVKAILTDKIDFSKYEQINIKEVTGLKGRKMSHYGGGKVIFFTSGTTGFGKPVVLTEKSIMADVYAASSLFQPDGAIFAVLPFHHAFGLITTILKPMYYNCPIFINSSLKKIAEEIKVAKPQTLFLVPAFVESFYRQILKMAKKNHQEQKMKRALRISGGLGMLGIDVRRKFFGSIHNFFGGKLKYIICGGAYLDKKYVKWFRKIGIEILNGYGITECSPVISVNRNHYGRDGSVGVAVRDNEVKIIDGEICVKGDIVMEGYYKKPKETAEVMKDGFYHTGDLGYIDKDGFIFVTGRKKNLIILSNGENVSPEEIEVELMKDKGVREVMVSEKDQKIVAEIYPEERLMGRKEYFDETIMRYNRRVPINRRVTKVQLRDEEFRKNNSRKIIRNYK